MARGSAGTASLNSQFHEYVPPTERLEGSLHSVGADTTDAITFGWIQLFRSYHPNVHVTMEARSSLTAVPALTEGTADIGPLARYAPEEDNIAFEKKFGYRPLLLRVGGGAFGKPEHSHAIAVYVNRENPVTHLTLAQIDAMFSSARRRGAPVELKTWGQLGLTGPWAKRPISVYAVRRPNGIADAFQHDVMLGASFRPDIHERVNSSKMRVLDAVVGGVANDMGGIGYAGFEQGTPAVKAVAIGATEAGPFVEGTLESVKSQRYPLARFIYIAVNKPPGKPLPPNVREFLRLALSRSGQQVIADEGYFLPLPAAVADEEMAKIN